ncbi:MAG TPA: hypothetical protein O0Y04_05675, partial [Methanocorpusculum sp.]|nr:hypothetical protein [Methanocorpusculum sp.]
MGPEQHSHDVFSIGETVLFRKAGGVYLRRSSERLTTVTELTTIAAAAYSGRNITCVNGYN